MLHPKRLVQLLFTAEICCAHLLCLSWWRYHDVEKYWAGLKWIWSRALDQGLTARLGYGPAVHRMKGGGAAEIKSNYYCVPCVQMFFFHVLHV